MITPDAVDVNAKRVVLSRGKAKENRTGQGATNISDEMVIFVRGEAGRK